MLRSLIYKLLRNPKNPQVHFWNTLQTAKILLSDRLTTFFAYIWNSSTSWKSRVGGIPSVWIVPKKHTLNVNACIEFHSGNEHFRFGRLVWSPKIEFEGKTTFFGLVVTLKSEMFISTAKFDASVDVERMIFFGKIQTLGSHQPSIFKKLKNFIYMRKNVVRRPLSNL